MTMSIKSSIAATAFVLAIGTSSVLAQTATPADPHHPAQGTSQTPAVPSSPAQPGMGGMQSMMGGMMNMMQMMHGMGMSQRGGMAMIDRIEGRIAFLRAELKITDAQATAWNAFADALRANAKKLAELRPAMMRQGAIGQQQQQSLGERLESQERWLLARYEGTRAIRSAFTALYGTLSDEQKKSADELLAPHMGMRMMTTAPGQPGPMMRGQMQSGQTSGQTQPGQVQPEQTQPEQTQPEQTQPRQMTPGRMQPGQMMPGAR